MSTQTAPSITPLSHASISGKPIHLSKSLLFSSEYKDAIIGKTKNDFGNEVLAYDEVKLVEVMYDQMMAGEEQEDREDEDVQADTWEDAKASVFCGLEEGLRSMGKWAPVLV